MSYDDFPVGLYILSYFESQIHKMIVDVFSLKNSLKMHLFGYAVGNFCLTSHYYTAIALNRVNLEAHPAAWSIHKRLDI